MANLFCLLTGFAILARHLKKPCAGDSAQIPAQRLEGRFCAGDGVCDFQFLDNIAAALIGGAMAHQLFKAKGAYRFSGGDCRRVQCRWRRFGGGDTTTTMMWIDGISPLIVLDAYIAAVVALVICRLLWRQTAACLFAHPQTATPTPNGLGALVDCWPDAGVCRGRQCHRQHVLIPVWPTAFRLSAWRCGAPSC